jgi:hypothetical protein
MMCIHGIYISEAQSYGMHYIAERARGGRRYLWSAMPAHLNTDYVRISAKAVPLHIRRAAYRWLGEQENHEQAKRKIRAGSPRMSRSKARSTRQIGRPLETADHPL